MSVSWSYFTCLHSLRVVLRVTINVNVKGVRGMRYVFWLTVRNFIPISVWPFL